MGVIQNSMNQAIGSLGAMAVISEHLQAQEIQKESQGLENWNRDNEAAKQLDADAKKAIAKSEQEAKLINDAKEGNTEYFRDAKGKFMNKNKYIEMHQMALDEANAEVDAKRYQANALAERLKIDDKMMGRKVLNRLANADVNSPEDKALVHDIKSGNYDPRKDYKGGNK